MDVEQGGVNPVSVLDQTGPCGPQDTESLDTACQVLPYRHPSLRADSGALSRVEEAGGPDRLAE